MNKGLYTRLFALAVIIFSALAFISYSHKRPVDTQDCSSSGSCSGKKVQSEFIIWESLSKNLLSNTAGNED